MRTVLALLALLYAPVAFAQSSPPTVGGKPLVQVQSRHAAAPKNQSVAEKLQACLDIDDGTKGRLDCYDAVVTPKPKPKPAVAKGVMDCRFIKEQDDRLACFNGFAESIPKLPHT
jgi:hypothetical protein